MSEAASGVMVVVGSAAAVLAVRQDRPLAVPVVFGFFAVMEALQFLGYQVIDQCGTPANEVITYLSVLHIAFQPVAINAFAMALVAGGVQVRTRVLVYSVSAVASAAMLLQLYPFDWAGTCRIGDALCGETLCTRTGTWHLAWDVPYNGLLVWVDDALGTRLAMPTYVLAGFGLPLLYGAWRFVLAHLVFGPVLAIALTTDPNEMPAIWCLSSIAIIAIGLIPWLWRRLEVRAPAPA